MIAKATEIAAGGLEDGNRIFPFSEWCLRKECTKRDGEMESKWNLLVEED